MSIRHRTNHGEEAAYITQRRGNATGEFRVSRHSYLSYISLDSSKRLNIPVDISAKARLLEHASEKQMTVSTVRGPS
jgi:hypothetical protein